MHKTFSIQQRLKINILVFYFILAVICAVLRISPRAKPAIDNGKIFVLCRKEDISCSTHCFPALQMLQLPSQASAAQ